LLVRKREGVKVGRKVGVVERVDEVDEVGKRWEGEKGG
jgi:hypothetical protein